jgi:hypothetical protein
MIKICLILSAAMLIATAIFGVLNRQAFVDTRVESQEFQNNWKVANNELVQVEETLQDTKEELGGAKDERDEEDAKLTLSKEKLMQKERAVKELEQTLEGEDLKLKEFRVVLEKFKDPVTGKVPNVEELKDKKESMTQDLGNKKAEAEGLRQKTSEADKVAKTNEAQIQTHIEKQRERAASFIRNGFEATITAVNNDWGFVIIDAGKNKGVRADSPLLVSTADGRRIGKLNVISIEPTVTVADIDQDSLSGGAKIVPGYKVLYEDVAQ